MFHSRLSIIDLNKRSNQPFSKHGLKLVYNGEIYNFKIIKDELAQLGYKFDTKSDTEVILSAYHKFGANCFKMFKGMWALAIWDDKKKEIILSRDRFGEKPLYFGINKNFFGLSSDLFGFSDLIDFKKNINNEAFQKYLQYNYVPSPLSIINGIFKLPASSFAEIKIDKILLNKYNDFNSLINSDFINFNYYWKIEDKINKQNLHTNS